jgi:hypothetical protein
MDFALEIYFDHTSFFIILKRRKRKNEIRKNERYLIKEVESDLIQIYRRERVRKYNVLWKSFSLLLLYNHAINMPNSKYEINAKFPQLRILSALKE